MVHCAKSENAELVIVSRDADYGITFDNKSYVNDHLRQEFSDRVSKKRKLLLYSRLSEALKHFAIPITLEEEQAELDIVASEKAEVSSSVKPSGLVELIQRLGVSGVLAPNGVNGT